jgi:uncharacterized membrane protein YeiH
MSRKENDDGIKNRRYTKSIQFAGSIFSGVGVGVWCCIFRNMFLREPPLFISNMLYALPLVVHSGIKKGT